MFPSFFAFQFCCMFPVSSSRIPLTSCIHNHHYPSCMPVSPRRCILSHRIIPATPATEVGARGARYSLDRQPYPRPRPPCRGLGPESLIGHSFLPHSFSVYLRRIDLVLAHTLSACPTPSPGSTSCPSSPSRYPILHSVVDACASNGGRLSVCIRLRSDISRFQLSHTSTSTSPLFCAHRSLENRCRASAVRLPLQSYYLFPSSHSVRLIASRHRYMRTLALFFCLVFTWTI